MSAVAVSIYTMTNIHRRHITITNSSYSGGQKAHTTKSSTKMVHYGAKGASHKNGASLADNLPPIISGNQLAASVNLYLV